MFFINNKKYSYKKESLFKGFFPYKFPLISLYLIILSVHLKQISLKIWIKSKSEKEIYISF